MSQISTFLTDAARFIAASRIGILSQRVIDMWSILSLVNPEVVITCEGGNDPTILTPQALIISPERLDNHRKIWTNQSLADLVPLVRDRHFGSIGKDNAPLTLLTYAATPAWEQFVTEQAGSIRLLAPSAGLKHRLDNKIRTRACLAAEGVPVPKYLIRESRTLDFEELSTTLGEPFFVQAPFSSAGIGTFEISSRKTLESVTDLCPDTVLVSSCAGATILNVHGLITEGRIEISFPSVQLSGVPEMVANTAGYCGNDFTAMRRFAPKTVEHARGLVKSVGIWLLSQGYAGLFGVDLALSDSFATTVLEVNPRLQGSTWLLAEIEECNEVVPSVVRHFMQLLRCPLVYQCEQPNFAPSGAQGILHLLEDKTRNIAHNLECAIYALGSDGHLLYRRPVTRPLTLGADEVFIFGLPPTRAKIDPGAVLARFACAGTIVGPRSRGLTTLGHQIVTALRREFRVAEGLLLP